jgi:putative type I restriction-modification system specificity determinant for hsdM and hsdR (hsdS)
MRRYESYKDSGVEWLGEVPSHWEVENSKRVFSYRKDKAEKTDEQLTSSQKYGVIPQDLFMDLEGRRVTVVEFNYEILKHVEKGDFVISMRSFQGGIEYCNYTGCVSSAYVALIPTSKVHSQYYRFLLKSVRYIEALQSTSNLVRDGQALRYENFCMVPLIVPPLSEQQKIAQFLDDKTAKIEQAVDLAEKQIALLKEHKQILIQNAVTRGLNPDVPLKDSGVEWIGLVPEHWEVKKLKYLGNAIIGLTYSPDDLCDESEGILVARSSNIQNGSFVYSDNVYVKKQIPKKLQLKEQDILICSRNGSRDLIGKCAYITKDQEKHTFGAFTTVFRSKYNPYLFYILNSEIFKRLSGNFLTSTINQLTINNLNSIQVALPPLLEQKKIANCLEVQTAKIDQAIALKTAHIEKLKEYKSVLINNVVTGKVQV